MVIRIPVFGKKVIVKYMFKGRHALQGMKGTKNIEISLSFLSRIVRVDKTAGTLQPKPRIKGIKERPEIPIFSNSRSTSTMVRDKYPVSSKKYIKMYKIKIMGAKERIAPSPPITPSVKKELSKCCRLKERITSLNNENK